MKKRPKPYERRRWLERGGFAHFAPEFTLRSASGVPAAVDLDFASNRAYRRNSGTSTAIAALTVSGSRASAAYYTDSQGLLTLVAADTVRIGDRGIFLEGPSTNITKHSQAFTHADWTNYSAFATITDNTTPAPDGTGTAAKLQCASAGNRWGVLEAAFQTAPAGRWTGSVFVKPGESGNFAWFCLNIQDNATPIQAFFELLDGRVGTQTNCTGRIERLTNGWFRVSIRSSVNTTANEIRIQTSAVAADNSTANAGSTTSDFYYLWGAQIENQNWATSYIPTTTAAVTRESDGFPDNGPLFVTDFNLSINSTLSTKFTMYAEMESMQVTGLDPVGEPNPITFEMTADNRGDSLATIGFQAASNIVSPIAQGAGFSVRNAFAVGGVPGQPITTTVNRCAFRAEGGGGARAWANGIDAGVDIAGGTWPDAPISKLSVGTASGFVAWGYIKRLTIWDQGLPNADLQALSIGGPTWLSSVGASTIGFAPTVAADLTSDRLWIGNDTEVSLRTLLVNARNTPTAYAEDSAGILHAFAANTPRLTTKGLFHERASTNLVLRSTAPGVTSPWSLDAGYTAIQNAAASPTGDVDATFLSKSTTTTLGIANFMSASGPPITLSTYVKMAGHHLCQMQHGNGEVASFNLLTQTVDSSGLTSGDLGFIEQLANGWFRIGIKYVNTAVTNYQLFFFDSTPSADGGGFYIWGPQVEASRIHTSYIPTPVGSAVTRPADANWLTEAGVHTLFGDTIGSYFIEGTYENYGNPLGWNPRFIDWGNEMCGSDPTGTTVQVYRPSLGHNLTGGTSTADGIKGMTAQTRGARTITANGEAVSTDTETFPLSANFTNGAKLFIGCDGPAGNDPATGFTRRIGYWRGYKVPNATIVTVTTP